MWTLLTIALAAEIPEIAEDLPPLPPPDTLQAALDAHNTTRRVDQVRGMSVLLGWSVANIGVGAAGWAIAREPEWRAFHQMSIAWNGVNLALAIPGLVGGLRMDPHGITLGATLRDSAGMRTTFAFNAGLDVGWVALGAWMQERGLRTGDDRFTGFGRSMMMQGGFLLVFDTTLWLLRADRDKRLMVTPAVGQRLGLTVSGAW